MYVCNTVPERDRTFFLPSSQAHQVPSQFSKEVICLSQYMAIMFSDFFFLGGGGGVRSLEVLCLCVLMS